MSPALTAVPTQQLERLLRAIRAGQLACPLEVVPLHLAGFADFADRLGLLRSLDQRGCEAVLLAVLAERGVASRLVANRAAVAERAAAAAELTADGPGERE